ncbi:Ferric reductase like transmembrane component [compost metagenome]
MSDWLMSLPLWEFIRASGIVSYLLLFTGMMLGILHGMPSFAGKTKAALYKWHTRSTWAGFLIGIAHGMVIYVDQYSPFTWKEIWIPFTTPTHPVAYGVGTLTVYGMLILLLTSDLRNKIKKPLWYAVHLLSYPIFFMALFHGLFTGSDTGTAAAKLMYALTGIGLIGISVYRMTLKGNRTGRVKLSE